MKICTTCNVWKPSDAFSKRSGSEKLRSYCKSCNSAYLKDHYRANTEMYAAKARKRQKIVRKWLYELKDGEQCLDCGIAYPHYVLDYDHRDPAEKRASVSTLAGECRSYDDILDEIAKCDLVCANCHRERTYGGN